MSDATERLARTRQALLEHVARRERRHDPREVPPTGPMDGAEGDYAGEPPPPYEGGGGWLGHLTYAVRTWWRYHPAHMALELTAPVMRSYARRKPLQLLGISLAAGAALTFARPWKLISIGTLAVAVLKSSQLSSLLLAALSAADYRKDSDRPG